MTRLVVYATLGILMSALGQGIDAWGFWCTLGLFWASNYLARHSGLEDGVAMGIEIYKALTPEQRAEVNKLMEEEQ